MKKLQNPGILPWFTLAAGGVGLILRFWLYAAKDDKGLLPANHVASTLIFLLTALVLAVLFLLVRPLRPVSRYSRLFPAGSQRTAGCVAGAAGILAAVISHIGKLAGVLDVLILLLGIAAAASLGYTAYLRLRGSRPGLTVQGVLTVFFMLYTVGQCRSWGAEPQLQEYIFPFLACVFLMLYAYYLAAAAAHRGNRRWMVFFSQAALYCCILSLNGADWPFCLGMALWLTLDLCSVRCKRSPNALPPEEAV